MYLAEAWNTPKKKLWKRERDREIFVSAPLIFDPLIFFLLKLFCKKLFPSLSFAIEIFLKEKKRKKKVMWKKNRTFVCDESLTFIVMIRLMSDDIRIVQVQAAQMNPHHFFPFFFFAHFSFLITAICIISSYSAGPPHLDASFVCRIFQIHPPNACPPNFWFSFWSA